MKRKGDEKKRKSQSRLVAPYFTQTHWRLFLSVWSLEKEPQQQELGEQAKLGEKKREKLRKKARRGRKGRRKHGRRTGAAGGARAHPVRRQREPRPRTQRRRAVWPGASRQLLTATVRELNTIGKEVLVTTSAEQQVHRDRSLNGSSHLCYQ